MKRATRIALCTVALGVLTAGNAEAQTIDTVRTVSLSPAGPVTRGVLTRISVVVETTFHSADSGVVRLGFNTTAANGARLIESQTSNVAGTE
jgi:hypothetical protein